MFLQAPRKLVGYKAFGRLAQRFRVRRLRAECNGLHTAEPAQHRDGCGGKPLGRAHRVGRGQAEHEIRAARERRPRAHIRGKAGRAAALDDGRRHYADGRIKTGAAHLVDHPRMARVKRIVFRHDPCDFHMGLPPFCRVLFLKMACTHYIINMHPKKVVF